jgi:ribonuclease-3
VAAHDDVVAALAARLDVPPGQGLLRLALTHRSYAYEHGGLPTNERLEFLGDAVLGLVVTDLLYRRHPGLPEGQLAKRRAGLVNARTLAAVAAAVGIGDALLLGRGEETTGGRAKPSILADALEAVVGAVHVEHGFPAAARVVRTMLGPLVDTAEAERVGQDWKTLLQERAAELGRPAPRYEVTGDGPDHARHFVAVVEVDGAATGRGEGPSKKQAEQRAAEAAVAALAAGAVGAG